jgi:hypothetical protein
MTRDKNFKKVDSQNNTIQFKGSWTKYTTTRNTDNTPLLGAIALKDFIGIDIDTDARFMQVLQLLNDINHHPAYIAQSLPKDANKGGHILFHYTATDADKLSTVVKYLKKQNIDIQLDNKLIYLATEANHTKKLLTPPIKDINDLTRIPEELTTFLLGLATPYLLEDLETASTLTTNINTANAVTAQQTDYYGYILDTSDLHTDIISRLTPKRDYPLIEAMDDIPHGQGTDWMLQVRKKLQTDKSVSPETMMRTMLYLNSLWTEPMPEQRVKDDTNRDIVSPDFKFSKTWKTDSLILTTDHKHTIEVLFSPSDASYIVFNRTLQEATKYLTFTNVSDVLMSLTGKKLPKDVVLRKATKVNIVTTPLHDPFIQQIKNSQQLPIFNNFIPSEGLQLLRDPKKLSNPRKPKLILDFLENLIPHKITRDKFIRYIAYKYSTYDYSPLYFVLAGVGGAGKGILVHDILSYLSGTNRVHSVDFNTLTNNFNSFMSDIDWLELEEAGEGYSKKDNEKLVGTLKRITGNENISIERKGKDAVTQRHFITPIISTNLHTKLITDTIANDRRLVLIKCPYKLTKLLPYTTDEGHVIVDTRDFLLRLRAELPHFAVYLSSLDKLSPQDYLDNSEWKSEDYQDYIEDTLTEHEKLYQAAENKDLEKFIHILQENRVSNERIDKLFEINSDHSYHGNASLVIYNTASTDDLSLTSLEDIYQESNTLIGEPRKDYKRIKDSKVKRKNFKVYKMQVIHFNTPYTPIGDIQPISTDALTENLDKILNNQ